MRISKLINAFSSESIPNLVNALVYLYVLALYLGGRNCDPNLPNEPCVTYTGTNFGTLIRIKPVR